MTYILITGPSGSGKTWIAREYIKKSHFAHFISINDNKEYKDLEIRDFEHDPNNCMCLDSDESCDDVIKLFLACYDTLIIVSNEIHDIKPDIILTTNYEYAVSVIKKFDTMTDSINAKLLTIFNEYGTQNAALIEFPMNIHKISMSTRPLPIPIVSVDHIIPQETPKETPKNMPEIPFIRVPHINIKIKKVEQNIEKIHAVLYLVESKQDVLDLRSYVITQIPYTPLDIKIIVLQSDEEIISNHKLIIHEREIIGADKIKELIRNHFY